MSLVESYHFKHSTKSVYTNYAFLTIYFLTIYFFSVYHSTILLLLSRYFDFETGTLSSYAWILLAISYCQRRGLIPSLQDSKMFPNGTIESPSLCKTARNGDLDTSFVEDVQRMKNGQWKKYVNYDQTESKQKTASIGKVATATSTTPSLGELFFGFFWFYAYEFDHKQACSTTRFLPVRSKIEKLKFIKLCHYIY